MIERAAGGDGALDHALGVAIAPAVDGAAAGPRLLALAAREVGAHRAHFAGQQRDVAVGAVHQWYLGLQHPSVELTGPIHIRNWDVRPDDRVSHVTLPRGGNADERRMATA